MTIIEQFRECLKVIPLGTQLTRQEIIEMIRRKYETKESSIIPSDYCYNMTSKGIPEGHVSFFLNIGKGLYEYVGEEYRFPTIKGIIAAYKADFARVDDEERYKWEALKHYKNNWNINAEDFAEMYREAYRYAGETYKRPRDGKPDGGNLLTSSMYYPYRMMCSLAQFEPETIRGLFKCLFDETKPLSHRLEAFSGGCDACFERFCRSAFAKGNEKKHDQDLRATSLYLAFEYPGKYYLYKDTMFKDFVGLLGRPTMYQSTSGGRTALALSKYFELCEIIISAVREDYKLQQMSKNRLDDNCYKDEQFHLLTMDIIYFGSQLSKKGAYNVKMLIDKCENRTTDIDKNTILYGPPGTGKTYHTALYAVAIIENETLKAVEREPYEAVMERYRKYKSDGYIEFTTFHQSYGYEEFIEGIRPTMNRGDEEAADLEYEIVPGLFKAFCERAGQPIRKEERQNYGLNDSPTVWKVCLAGAGENQIRTECLDQGCIRIGWDEYGEILTDETNYVNGGRIVLNSFINRMSVGDIVFSCYSSTTIDAIGVVTGEYEWHSEYSQYKRLRRVNWLVKGIREDITGLNGTTMTLSSVYRLNISAADAMALALKYMGPEKHPPKSSNYVFIIDEINRGNISKIFGELITLIEPTKRLGQPEELTVKLPYSKKPFGVPDNVYLIGTMNTADRSIAAIDTALRRRFQFREMMPDAELLKNIKVEDISIKDMLERMNRRIEVLYDREHTVGHGYFLPLRKEPTIVKLAEIFRNNILPLLQEYFFDDYEKIRLVLGDNQKDSEEKQFIIARPVNSDKLFGSANVGVEDRVLYAVNPVAFDLPESYHSI